MTTTPIGVQILSQVKHVEEAGTEHVEEAINQLVIKYQVNLGL
jgi:hypothetical protein